MRSLTPYSTAELAAMKIQAYALIPTTMNPDDKDYIVEILHAINVEIARRHLASKLRDQEDDLAAGVCGYARDGSLLPAVENHRFAHIARSPR